MINGDILCLYLKNPMLYGGGYEGERRGIRLKIVPQARGL